MIVLAEYDEPVPRPMLNTYHIGDARKIHKLIPSQPFVDVTITSPPYWNLKDYGSKSQVGYAQPYEKFLDDLEKIFGAILHITKNTGSLWIVADTIKHDGELILFPFDLAQRLKNVGWSLHDIIIWNKDKTLPWSHRGKLRNIFEYILFFSKGKKFQYYLSELRESKDLKEWWIRYPERYSPEGKAPSRTWTIPIPRQGSWGENWVRHFCPLPIELVRRIVLLTTKQGDVALDPFAGSGVVLAQAAALKRRFVGIDLRRSYRRMFEDKVRPSIERLEESNSKSLGKDEKQKRKFASLIWRLRKTKYPRELVRLYEKYYGIPKMSGVLELSIGLKTLNVYLLLGKNYKSTKRLKTRLRKIMRRPPLSKYGLKVNIFPLLPNRHSKKFSFPKCIKSRTRLALYSSRNTHQSTGQTTVRAFLKSLGEVNGHRRNKSLLIASNIHLKVTKESVF